MGCMVEMAGSFLVKNGYKLDRGLKRGSYAKVTVGWSEKMKIPVAIKTVDERTERKDYIEKFFSREKEMVTKLKHIHIVKFFQILQNGPLTFIVSELAENGDLLDCIKNKNRLSDGESKFLFRQLTEALYYLHSRNILHRDIKCENIFLDKDGNVKLGDFGFLRCLNTGELSRTACGSQPYVAPEINIGKPYADCSVDMWSTGVVLYIMLTGVFPFDASNLRKMLDKQQKHEITYSESLRNSVSEEAKNLIYGLLDPQPSTRFKHEHILRSRWLRDIPWLIRRQNRILRAVSVRSPSLSELSVRRFNKM